jgi:hypothetical protein
MFPTDDFVGSSQHTALSCLSNFCLLLNNFFRILFTNISVFFVEIKVVSFAVFTVQQNESSNYCN